MRAMILAAGKGTRLRPLTDTTPKPLLEVAGRPMIAFPLKLVRDAGIETVVINLHHLGEQIRATLGTGAGYGVHITYSAEDPVLETGGGIAACKDVLGGDTFVVLNADTYLEINLLDVLAFHRSCRALVTLVLRPDPEVVKYGAVEIDATRRVRRFLGHTATPAPAATEPLTPLMYAGVMVLEPRIFSFLWAGIYSITREVFPRLLHAGEAIYGHVYTGYWRVLDTPEDLAAGRREIPARVQG